MNSFSFYLDRDYIRPVIELYGAPAIVDTGAVFPVVSYTLDELDYFQPEITIDNPPAIGGIGGQASGKIVSLKNFEVGTITFERCDFFLPDEKKLSFPFLLSAAMFQGTDYYVKNTKRQFVVEVPTTIPAKRNFILKVENDAIVPYIDGILVQECDINYIPYMSFNKNPYRNILYNSNVGKKEISIDGLHKAFERYEENGSYGICGDWKVEHDLSSSSSLWKLSFAGTPLVICESKPKHDYITRLNRSLSDKTFIDICEIAQSVFPECRINSSEKRKIQQNQSQGR